MVRTAARTNAHRARLETDDGFSLVEFVIAAGLSIVVLGASTLLMQQFTRSYNAQADSVTAQEEAQFAIDWMTRYIRSAGANPYTIRIGVCPGIGTQFTPIQIDPLGTGLANNIRIHADVNPPNGVLGGLAGACREADEDVTIAHDVTSSTITKRDNNTEQAAASMTDNVISGLTFTYLDGNRVATANAAQVAYVQMVVTARTASTDEYTRQRTSYSLNAEVRLRSR